MQAWSLKPKVNLRVACCVHRTHQVDQSWVLRCTQWWQYACSEAIGESVHAWVKLKPDVYALWYNAQKISNWNINLFTIVLTVQLCPMPPSINCRTTPMTVWPCAESRHSQVLWKVLISTWLVGIAYYGFSFLNIITWKKRFGYRA